MGCGASKMQSDEEARYRPILRRRLEEFMARRNAGLSKKQLLAGEGILPHEYEADEDIMKTPKEDETTKDCDHFFHDTQDCPPSPQKMASTTTTIIHDNNKVHKNNVDDRNGSNVDDHDKNNVGDHNDNVVDDEHKGKDNNKGDNDTVEEEKRVHQVSKKETVQVQEEEAKCSADDAHADLQGTEFCPGSPSFRVYCVNNSDEELEDTAENQDFEDCDKQDDEPDCIRQESSNSNVQVADEKKQKRRRKFKRISIPKGGKKVLHSMHSFYNFPCNSNNSQLMQQETAPQPKPNVKEV